MAIEPTDIEEQAKAPKRTRTDEGVVEERPISELIDADRYNKASQVTNVPWGLKIARVRPGGTV
jgi:hypothetical protein